MNDSYSGSSGDGDFDAAAEVGRATDPSAHPAGPGAGAGTFGSARPSFPWPRLFYAIGFGVVAWCVFWVLIFLAAVQFVLVLLQSLSASVSGHPSDELKRFNLRLIQYLLELLAYITFVRETLPFPFSPFPAVPGSKMEG